MSEHRDTITVPDAIMKESFKVAKEALHAADACDCDLCAADAQMAITRALISAEARGMERAAKIADEHARLCDVQNVVVDIGREQFAFRAVAAAIRNGTEA